MMTRRLVLMVVPALAAADDRDEFRDLSKRLREIRGERGQHLSFLREQAAGLLDRARAAERRSYVRGRLIEALDSLLDAAELLIRAAKPRRRDDDDDDDKASTARTLEKTYFRVSQADYYARVSKEKRAPEYVTLARRLYQTARSEYDAGAFYKARRIAEAAGEIVGVLDNLAQAAVRVPDPPKLED